MWKVQKKKNCAKKMSNIWEKSSPITLTLQKHVAHPIYIYKKESETSVRMHAYVNTYFHVQRTITEFLR